jgi:uncharacterized membrane protein
VTAVGERAFQGIYSLVAFVTLGGLIAAYRAAPPTAPLWPAGEGVWTGAAMVMLVASVLLVGSLVGNPAMTTVRATGPLPEAARGVFAVTRHPMMWALALWGISHIAVMPTAANIVLSTAIIILALVGAALQDRKKRRLQPRLWPVWEARTSFLPFAAIAGGRARLGGFGAHALLGGTLLWVAATWAHRPLAGAAVGLWRWL